MKDMFYSPYVCCHFLPCCLSSYFDSCTSGGGCSGCCSSSCYGCLRIIEQLFYFVEKFTRLFNLKLYFNFDENVEHFKTELGWREFSYYLLYHFPHLPDKNLQQKFDRFPWKYNIDYLNSWKRGKTGYPIVDAGMRELWETGYMHNRVRMIVGSFLVKNLLQDWRYGEQWFWDCLFDADLASNSASWQWVAGSGADAAPYFRIFNPVSQGQRFDFDVYFWQQNLIKQ